VNVVWPVSLGVGATDAEIGLAWADHDAAGPAVRFARVAPDLELISTSHLDDVRASARPTEVAVAPLLSGWIVGITNPDGVSAIFADASGAFAARTVLDQPPIEMRDDYGSNLVIAGHAGAGPLIAWRNGNSLRATVIASDGRSATTPINLPFHGRIVPASLSAAFFGDAFYVAFVIDLPGGQLQLTRIAQDGSTSASVLALEGEQVGFPRLVAGPKGLGIVYEDSGEGRDLGMMWRRISVTGDALGSRVLVAPPQRYLNASPGAALGSDIFILAGGRTGPLGVAHALGIIQIDSADQIARPVFDVAIGRGMMSYNVVTRGPDLIVAWLGGGSSADRIGIARLPP
jgi:hypothetical protein